jgi:hypothetical protein
LEYREMSRISRNEWDIQKSRRCGYLGGYPTYNHIKTFSGLSIKLILFFYNIFITYISKFVIQNG